MNQLPLLGVATDPPSRARPGVAAAADAIVARWADLAASRRTRGLPAPPEPRFADPRRVVGRDAVERAVARYGMADVLLVVEWAFQAPGYHPRLLRGEEGDGTIYLGLANLLRITKIPEKLDKAQQWDAAGREIEETSRAGYYEGAGDLAAKLEMEAWPEDCPFHAARGAK